MRPMIRIALLSCLLLAACKKKDEAKPVEPTAVKSAPEAPTAAAPAKATEPAKPAVIAVTIASAAEYDTKATELFDKLVGVFAADGKDCDKLAADLTKLTDEQGALFAGLQAFEQANPDAKQAFDDKMKGREKDYEAKVAPSFEACQKHEAVIAAIAKLPL